MEKRDNGLRSGVLTAVLAALGDQKEILERDQDRAPRLELEEIKAELDREVSNEIAYLRDAGIVSTRVEDETVEIKLNSKVSSEASEIKELMYEEFGGSLEALATSGEYMDFEPPSGEWSLWEGPERNDLATGSVDYEENLGSLCAVVSMYGEERLQGADITEYSVGALEERLSLDGYELELDLKEHLETLERLGYVEKHSTDFNDVYRLASDEEVKTDAEMIAEHRNEVFSGHPENMAFAYEEGDRVELEKKGVKLVQRPGKTDPIN